MLLRFLVSTGNYLLGGKSKVPLEVYVSRLTTCLHCSDYDPEVEACVICGCYVRSKALRANEQCPRAFPLWKVHKTEEKPIT